MPEDEHRWIGQYILNDAGDAVPERDVLAWAVWMTDGERRVNQSSVGNLWISTVFLGLDHDFFGFEHGDPLIYQPLLWETMVFHGRESLECFRYRSKADAQRGHDAVVERLAACHNPA